MAEGKSVCVCIAGDGGVGKSALTVRFCHEKFLVEYNPTIEDAFRKATKIGNETVTIDVLDTAGQEEYRALLEQHFSRANGFLLVYAVDNRETFEALDTFREMVARINGTAPIILVGNKCDLTTRKVTEQEGKEAAKRLGAKGFFETSAKTRVNVSQAFEAVATAALSRAPASPRRSPGLGGGDDGAGQCRCSVQ
eukprot:m51a1_g12229 putative ras gtpase (195) ;mRNA; r:74348-75277